MLKRLAVLVASVNTTVKVIFWIVALLGTLTGAYSTGKAVLAVPAALATHDSVTRQGNRTLDRMLCLQVADHRKLDWRLCWIDPKSVVPFTQ